MRITKKTGRKHVLSVCCLLLLIALILPVSAYAAPDVDLARQTSLTVECRYDGSPVRNVRFVLYKVADMNAAGEFAVTSDFSGYPVSLTPVSADGWRVLAQTLAQYALRDNIRTAAQAATDANGNAIFNELNAGLYLVYGYRHTNGNVAYVPEPFLVSLPKLTSEDVWVYDLVATGKGEFVVDPPETTSVHVLKVWRDDGAENDRPAEIEVQLLRDGKVAETVVLSERNNWRYTWSDLDAFYTWSVVEKTVPEGYEVMISKEGVTYLLTNTYKPSLTEVSVEKIWYDATYESKRPASIEVQLLCDEQPYAAVTLSATNSWIYTWTGLESGHTWTVREKNVPTGYTVKITQSGGKFTITNTYEKPKLPQTGQMWWPVPILLCTGLAFYIFGFAQRKRQKRHDK